ncbi:phage tail protein [Paenibacillus thiaminolyticus]|uniref:phage tail-collar fiber domain-containing protein n=1 Tax=Paenibacillus thiaminolyticus TaxID=49283 RepID=UPI0025429850|nr:phage tail protein [Paenibacillus thiaminolyticus]WII40330.1 phage tail protein [Paenibacillus thiaminolyticus]
MITNRGKALQAKAQTGVELHYTRFRVGDGQLGGRPISDLNGLINPVLSLPITKLQARAGGRAVVGTVITNQDVTAGFYFREIGIFAQDPDVGEILYCYGNAGETADYIPAKGGANIIEEPIEISTIVGNASNVTATIDGSMVYATHDDVAEALQEARKYTDDNNNAKILAPKAFKAEDAGNLYPKGMSIFWLEGGKDDGWPANNGQVVTWFLAGNRLNQIFFETDVRSQRLWTRRWSSTSNIWSEFRELETTNGSAEKVAQALSEAKAYTDDKTSNIDAPVKAVNGKTGDVVLTADDVGAVPKTGNPTISGNLSVTQRVEAAFLQAESNGGLAGIIAANGTTSAPKDVYVEFKTRGVSGPRSGYIGLPNPAAPDDIVLHSDNGGISLHAPNKKVLINGIDVVGELNLVKQSVVEGKGVIAEVINGKGGGPVSANNTFPELAAAIANIHSGGALLPNISVWVRKSAYADGIGLETADAAVLPARTNGFVFTATRGGSSIIQCGGMKPGGFADILLIDSNGASIALLQVSSQNGSYPNSLAVDSIFINLAEKKAIVYYQGPNFQGSNAYLTAETLLTSLNTAGSLKLQVRAYKEADPNSGYASAVLAGWAFMA